MNEENATLEIDQHLSKRDQEQRLNPRGIHPPNVQRVSSRVIPMITKYQYIYAPAGCIIPHTAISIVQHEHWRLATHSQWRHNNVTVPRCHTQASISHSGFDSIIEGRPDY